MNNISNADLSSNSSNTSSTTTTNIDHNSYFATARNLVGIWELIIFIVGFPANLLVLIIAWMLMRGYKSRNTTQWFVVSMTVADLLFTLIHSPMMFAQYSLKLNFNSSACLTMYIATYACTTASSLSMLLLNIDKFIYLHKPLHYFMIVTKPKVTGATAIIWVMAFVWAMFFLLGPFSVYEPPCDFRPAQLHFYVFFAIFFFTLPIILSLITSIYIAMIVVRAQKERRLRQERHFRSRTESTKSDVFAAVDQLKTISFVFTTTIWSTISCLPYRIGYILNQTKYLPEGNEKIYVFYFLFALMATNAVGNPFVTIISQHQFMQKFKEIIGKVSKQKFVFSRGSTSLTLTTVHSVVDSRKDSLETNLTPKSVIVSVKRV